MLHVREDSGGLPKPGCEKFSVQVVGGATQGFSKWGLTPPLVRFFFFPEAAQNRTVLPSYVCSLKLRKADVPVCFHRFWGLKWQVDFWTARW